MTLSVLAPLAALPWLQGFFAPVAHTDSTSHEAVAELGEWRALDESCSGSAYGGMSLTADLAPTEGAERVLASYTQGLVVLDRERHMIAQAPGFDCEGSGDELIALAVGDAVIGVPVLAMAGTSGGRTESVTWLTLYRVAGSGELQPMFIGEVERHANSTIRTGVITVIPGGLVHRDPLGNLSLWVYNVESGRYEEQLTTRPLV